MSGAPPENAVRVMINPSAVVVKPKQPFLDWLHRADPTSGGITLEEVGREPTIYLIPECDTKDEVHEVLEELCEEIFVEPLDSWFRDKKMAKGSQLRGVLPLV